MSRDQLASLLDAILVTGNEIGDLGYFERLHDAVGRPFSGEPHGVHTAKQIVLMAFDKGLLEAGDAIPSNDGN